MAWLYFSKWGSFVLGKDQNDTETEYSDFSWVLMMVGPLSTGISHFLYLKHHDYVLIENLFLRIKAMGRK